MSDVRRIELGPAHRERLAQTPLLSTLRPEDRDAGLARCPLLEVGPATRIVEEGEYEDRFYILVSGRCEVAIEKGVDFGGTVAKIVAGKDSSGGARPVRPAQTLGSLQAGDFFGELACMSPWPRTSTVFSTGTAVVLEVDQEVFDDWMAASGGFRRMMEEAYLARGLRTLLRGMDAFAPLGDEALRELCEGATSRTYDKGQVIVGEGDEGDAFYVIRGGVVAVSKRRGEIDKTVSYLRAGGYFGEMSLLDGTRRTATVTATNRTEVIRIARDRLLAIVERYPSAAAELRRVVSERARAAEAILGDEAMADALSFMAGQGILEGADVLVVDLQKCIYCGYCEEACAATHDVSLISLHGPSHDRFLFPTACRNCDDPLCLLNCPVDAINRDLTGEVKIWDHCIGCAGCAVNCPYDTISLRPVSEAAGEAAQRKAALRRPVTQQAIKCDLCEGIASGPQCVRSCPTAAILRFKPKQLVKHVLKQAG
jgi:CRP-like cAMP-binding protein/Na+-translocating ferredoxin:NAD+ oxidoreductase RNF subunit RnfB